MEKNSTLTRLVHEIKSQPIIERLEQEKNNRFLEHECSIVLSAPENISYYNHIIVNKNISLLLETPSEAVIVKK